jgi:predicted AAA+ superfamily ATPase
MGRSPAVILLGPRQVGKTTLAVEVTKRLGGVYLDLESERDRAKLAQPELYFDDHQNELVSSMRSIGCPACYRSCAEPSTALA